MFFSYAESAGWLTSSGTMSRTVGWTVVDISCSVEAHDKQELGDDRMKLSGKGNLADFSSSCHRCSVHWCHIWVTVSLDHWAIAHLWTPPLFIWPKATGKRIMPGELFTPLYNTIVPRPHYQQKFVCLFDGNEAVCSSKPVVPQWRAWFHLVFKWVKLCWFIHALSI